MSRSEFTNLLEIFRLTPTQTLSLLPVVVVVDVVDDGCEERALEDARPQQEAALHQLLPGDISLVITLVAIAVASVPNTWKCMYRLIG